MSINLRLDEELHAELQQIAEAEERSVSNLIRRMLRQSIDQYRTDQPQRAERDRPE